MPGLNVRVHVPASRQGGAAAGAGQVIEARELKGVDSGGTSDPICVVTVMGRKQETEKYHKVTNSAGSTTASSRACAGRR